MFERLAKKYVSNSFIVSVYLALRRFFSAIHDMSRKGGMAKKAHRAKKPVLYLLEFHVAEHCNMNCNHCFHFSSLVKEKSFPSLEQFKKDIARLGEIFDNIRTIRLMGGEPLLNDELPQFIYETRKVFPKAKINVLSNGLLYKKLDGELLTAFITCNASIHVSLYKPMIHKKDEMARHFTDKGVKHWISNPILRFAKYINVEGTSDPKKVVRQCPASRCTFLSNGHIARCPLPFNIKYFNKRFNHAISMDNELIDIHKLEIDGFALKKRLAQPMESCRYCTKLEWVDWNQIQPTSERSISVTDFCSGKR